MEHKRFKEFGFACVGMVLVVLLAGGSPVGLGQAQAVGSCAYMICTAPASVTPPEI